MREIKLRAKDKVNKEWIYSNGYYFDGINYWFIIPSDYPALAYASHRLVVFETIGQYTGLQDKNGKEIYEGDILRESDLIVEDIISVVEWGTIEAHLGWADTPCMTGWVARSPIYEAVPLYVYSITEVIGNIYESPELLEG